MLLNLNTLFFINLPKDFISYFDYHKHRNTTCITIDQNLTFTEHVNYLCNKIIKTIGVMIYTTGVQLHTYCTRTRHHISPLIIQHDFCRKCIRYEVVKLENKTSPEIINKLNIHSLKGFIYIKIKFLVCYHTHCIREKCYACLNINI